MAAPAFQTAGTGAYAIASSIVITKPASLAAGDIMVAFIHTEDDATSVTTPAGWTAITTAGSSGVAKIHPFWRTADASDVSASDFTFSLSGSDLVAGGIVRASGHDVGAPIVAQGGGSAGNGTSPSYTVSLTTTTDNLLLFAIAGRGNAFTTSGQSFGSDSVNEAWDLNSASSAKAGFSLAYGPKATGAAISSASATLSLAATTVAKIVSIGPPTGGNAMFMGANF